jgi:hypothetical protein
MKANSAFSDIPTDNYFTEFLPSQMRFPFVVVMPTEFPEVLRSSFRAASDNKATMVIKNRIEAIIYQKSLQKSNVNTLSYWVEELLKMLEKNPTLKKAGASPEKMVRTSRMAGGSFDFNTQENFIIDYATSFIDVEKDFEITMEV